MIDELVPVGSRPWWVLLGILIFGRGMDLLSTWLGTPRLLLEANPVARKLGWRGGLTVNAFFVVIVAAWPLPAIAVATTSVLVAARNLQQVWLMRHLGEHGYRSWLGDRLAESSRPVFVATLLLHCALIAVVGAVLMLFSRWLLVPFAVGLGIVTYAVAVLFYTLLGLRRLARRGQNPGQAGEGPPPGEG